MACSCIIPARHLLFQTWNKLLCCPFSSRLAFQGLSHSTPIEIRLLKVCQGFSIMYTGFLTFVRFYELFVRLSGIYLTTRFILSFAHGTHVEYPGCYSVGSELIRKRLLSLTKKKCEYQSLAIFTNLLLDLKLSTTFV